MKKVCGINFLKLEAFSELFIKSSFVRLKYSKGKSFFLKISNSNTFHKKKGFTSKAF